MLNPERLEGCGRTPQANAAIEPSTMSASAAAGSGKRPVERQLRVGRHPWLRERRFHPLRGVRSLVRWLRGRYLGAAFAGNDSSQRAAQQAHRAQRAAAGSGETCGDDGNCVPLPTNQGVGLITVSGMSGPVEMEARAPIYYYNFKAELRWNT